MSVINSDERNDNPTATAHCQAIRDAAQAYADVINAAQRDGYTVDVFWQCSHKMGYEEPDLIVETVKLTETACEG